MPTIHINGQPVQVGEEFLKLTPDQQNDTVDEIAASMGIKGSNAPQDQQGQQDPPEAGQMPIGSQEAPTVVDTGSVSHSPVTAAYESAVNGLPAALENGAATLGRTFSPSHSNLWDSLSAHAVADRKEQAAAYQRPADVVSSPTDALIHGHPLDALKSIGYSAAENAAPMGLPLALAAIPGIGPVAAGAVGGLEGADGVEQTKEVAGLGANKPLTLPDGLNVATQALLSSIPAGKLGAPIVEKGFTAPMRQAFEEAYHPAIAKVLSAGTDAAGKAAVSGAGAYAKGVGQSLANAGYTATEGGDVGSVGDVLRNASDAGLTNATLASAGSAIRKGVSEGGPTAITGLDLSRAYGTNFGKGIREIAARTKALQNATTAEEKAKVPELSDNAKAAQELLNYQTTIQDRHEAQGGSASGDVTAKSDLQARKDQLNRIAKYAKQAGQEGGGYTEQPADIADMIKAVATEAGQHNRAVAPETEGNAAPSAQQRLMASSLPDEIKKSILASANVLDTEAYDGKKMNRRAFAAPLAAQFAANIGPIAGMAIGHALGGGTGAIEGGLIGSGAKVGGATAMAGVNRYLVSKARKAGEKVDTLLGLGVPQGQKGMKGNLRLAARYGVTSSLSQDGLNDIEDGLASAAAANLTKRVRSGTARATTANMRAAMPSQAPQAPQAPPMGQVAPTQAAPSATPRSAPYVHTASELASANVPGWMAAVADQNGVSKLGVQSWLSNRVADGEITPEQYVNLTGRDNIGTDINTLSNAVALHKALGTWDAQSRIRDPKASPKDIDALLKAVGVTQPESKSGSSKAADGRKDYDFDGAEIRNMGSYLSEGSRAAEIGDEIIRSNPHLTAAVTAMNHTDGKPGTDNEGSRTPSGRQAILQAEVSKLPKAQRADAALALSRLVPFGYKGKAKTGG